MSAESILAESFRLLSAGDADGAERALAPLWSNRANRTSKAHMLMGLIRHAQKRMTEAESFLVAAASMAPNDAQVQFNLGNFRLRAEQLDEAIEAFQNALKISPDFSEARLGLANALDLAGRHTEAEWALTSIAVENHANAGGRLLSRILANQGRYAEARKYVSARLAQARNDPNTRFENAFLLHKERRHEEALAEYSALEREGVVSETLFSAKATALLGVRRVDEAMAVFRQGAECFPTSARLHSEWADARRLSGMSKDEATDEFERALFRAPQDPGLRLACAQSLLRVQRTERATEITNEGLRQNGDHPALHWLLGACAVAAGDFAAAEQAYRRAASLAPTKGILKSLAHTLLRRGSAIEALAIIEPSMEAAPNDQEWLAYYCTALRIASDSRFSELADVESFVKIIDLPAPASGWTGLVRTLDRFHASHNGAFEQIDQIAIQVPRPLMNDMDDELRRFFSLALDATREFVRGLPRSMTHPFLRRIREECRLAGAWTVRLIEGGSHTNHVHPMGWISSAFYAKVPPRQEGDDPCAGWLTCGEPDAPMPSCSPLRFVEPKVGRLVLFPSYMWHGTIPFPRGERMTIAFDMLPFGS